MIDAIDAQSGGQTNFGSETLQQAASWWPQDAVASVLDGLGAAGTLEDGGAALWNGIRVCLSVSYATRGQNHLDEGGGGLTFFSKHWPKFGRRKQ